MTDKLDEIIDRHRGLAEGGAVPPSKDFKPVIHTGYILTPEQRELLKELVAERVNRAIADAMRQTGML
jgi:hypothetical protein